MESSEFTGSPEELEKDYSSLLGLKKELETHNEEKTEFKEEKTNLLRTLPFVVAPIIAIVFIELLLYEGRTKETVLAHTLLLLGFSFIITATKDREMKKLYQAFMLLPILRLVNLSMPIFFDASLYCFIFVYAPLAIPATMAFIHQGITYEKKERTLKNIWIYLPFSLLAGLLLGAGEYSFIRTEPLIPDLSIVNLLQLIIVMVFFVALIEELIFRSILQTRLEEFFGSAGGIFFASLLFGVMHSGYGSPYEIAYAFFVGIFIGDIYRRTRSIFLITLIHGSLNVFLFGIIPHLSPLIGLY
ncbi:CPBP family intramembrane metalloprotease [Methanosarcina sp. KYL-1]|uniref:CPBP family intramembrane glutamic endopeptidase n=1 Tax=Methanosarcina sp. KYL-1 TaxID=2602068 RepID=UPI0021006AC9|nr:CPBP family intramembrane glutamic endopeptidase [Methanosarcina sp. KYL-1]MCQ1535077.1 CPBP family intramembrane metalloprotease [Methanosarcina sp. KYL-1]